MLGVEILSQPFGHCRGSVCVCLCTLGTARAGPISPVLPALPSSGQPGASDALGSGQPPPHRQPRAGSCCSGDTAVAQLVAPLHSLCSCRNTSATMGTTQVPSEINTLNSAWAQQVPREGQCPHRKSNARTGHHPGMLWSDPKPSHTRSAGTD